MPKTREQILREAKKEHDATCRSCTPRYYMSCPNMAKIILRQAGRKQS